MDEINNLDSGTKEPDNRVRPTQNVHEVKHDGQKSIDKTADNYKNTPMGKAVQKKYADILHGSRPEPSYRHPRMTLSNRAKIFSPFAALRGYEEEIAAEGEEHLKVTKIELSEEDKGKLSDKLLQVKKGMEVTVCFFEADDVEPAIFDTPAEPARSATHLGNYRTVTGIVNHIDSVYRELKINTGIKCAWEGTACDDPL